jgi:transposase
MKVTPEKFVTIWMTSESREEVAKRTGLTLKTVIRYGWTYRSNGVALKKLAEERKGANWDQLSTLCDSLHPIKEHV